MIIKKDDLKIELKHNMRGGQGSPQLTHVIEEEILGRQGRLFGKIEMKPGESIGYHQHLEEREIFYFLKGNGMVKDGENLIAVSSGDVMVTPDGSWHSVENTGNEDLVFMALILNTNE